MNTAFCSTADQYAGETCFLSILKGYCVTSVLVFSSLMEYQWCVESVSPPKAAVIGLITLWKIYEVIPIKLIFAATFNDTTHLAMGLLLKHWFSPVFKIGQNPTKQSWHNSFAVSLLTQEAADSDKWGHGYQFCMLSSEGETTARLCDINAHVTATRGTTTINIEIFSDTSKPVRNEPLYL